MNGLASSQIHSVGDIFGVLAIVAIVALLFWAATR